MKNMKKIVAITLLSLICASAAFAQIRPRLNTKGEKLNHLSDSLIIVYSPDSIKISNSWKNHPAKVEVFGSESDTSFHYDYTVSVVPEKKEISFNVNDDRKHRASSDAQRYDFSEPFYRKLKNKAIDWDKRLMPGNFGFALISTGSDVPDFRLQRSYEIFLDLDGNAYLSKSGRHTLNYGVGFCWKNLSMTKEMMFKDDEGKINYSKAWPEHSDPKVSKLRVFSFTVPVTYSCDIASGFGFTLGPVVNFNAWSSIVNKYRLNDEKQKDKYKGTRCNPVTVDLMFQLNFRQIGAYVKYSPMNLMDTDYWPEFKCLAVGLTINL